LTGLTDGIATNQLLTIAGKTNFRRN